MQILFVCTGNICRSPMAERLTRAYLDDALGTAAAHVATGSAGTRGVVGSRVEPSSALALRGLGGDDSGFAARQLTTGLVDFADLVLTMTRRHRHEALKMAPQAMGRAFTLREAADLLAGVDVPALPPVGDLVARSAALVAALRARRATRGRVEPGADDVMDPIGQRLELHQAVAAQIFDALVPLLQVLCGRTATASSSEARAAGAPPAPSGLPAMAPGRSPGGLRLPRRLPASNGVRQADDTLVLPGRRRMPPVPQ